MIPEVEGDGKEILWGRARGMQEMPGFHSPFPARGALVRRLHPTSLHSFWEYWGLSFSPLHLPEAFHFHLLEWNMWFGLISQQLFSGNQGIMRWDHAVHGGSMEPFGFRITRYWMEKEDVAIYMGSLTRASGVFPHFSRISCFWPLIPYFMLPTTNQYWRILSNIREP